MKTPFVVLSLLYLFTIGLFAQADPLRVAVMPSFTQNQTYGNAEIGKPVAVWGRAWGGTAPYSYTLDRGDGSSASGAVADAKYIGGDHTYASSGSKAMTLTVTDSAGSTVSRSATVRVFLNPAQDIRVNIAIERGLLWHYRNHIRSGDQVYWNLASRNYNEYQLATVGFATLAFEENGHKLGNDYEEDIYAELVQGGINRILKTQSGRTTLGSGQFYNHSDGLAQRDVDYLNSNGYGAYLWGGGHGTYVNGICGLALALATDNEIEAQNTFVDGGALNGMSHFEVMQDLVEQFSFSMTDGDASRRGGWIYGILRASEGGRDGSSQQWPCLFMRGASDLHGIESADWVKDGIDISFTGLQNASGAVGYRSNTQWLNTGKAGGAMVAWSVAGKDSTYPQVQKAVDYVGNQFYQRGGWNPPTGWAGYLYASYALKKGLALMEIETIATPQGPRNWYSDMASWFLGETPDAVHASINPGGRNTSYMFGQHSDGRWTGAELFDNMGPAYSTANTILILTRAVTVPLPVAVIDDFTDPDSPDPEDDGSSDLFDEVKAGQNVSVSGSGSFHQAAPDFVINQYQWILRADDGAGSPVGALDWNSPDYTGVNIVLDRDPADGAVDGLLPGVYHISLRVRDDADPALFSTTTEVFEAVNKNFPPIAVPIPAGQIAYTGEFVPGNAVQVTLDGTQSYDPEGDAIVSYAWDLDGDGEFNDPEDRALADDATSPTPTLTFLVTANIEVGLEVCSVDEFGDIKCSSNQARVEIFVTELDLSVASISASNIVQGVSADLAVEFASDLTAPLSGVQVQFYDNVPPIYGGGGVALGGVSTVDFVDDGSGNYTASLAVSGLALNAGTEEVYVFIDSNTAVPEHDESLASNVAAVNVSNQPPIAQAKDLILAVGDDCLVTAVAAAFDDGSSDPDGDPLALSISPAGPWGPGTYQITLSVSDGKETATDTATLTVVDTTAPVITLNGGDSTLECSVDVYVDAGASVTDNCDAAVQVVIGGDTVDVTTGGTYTVTYNATDVYGNSAMQVTRTITVQDTTAPVITLNGGESTLECSIDAYVELGATAADTCDPSLGLIVIDASAVDTSTPGSYSVTYSISDASGNAALETRTVEVVDTTPPAITLLGANPQLIECAASYVELGATAADTCDLTLGTVSIDASDVDTSTPGSYSVTYDISDASGNAASQLTRTVNVVDTTAPAITLIGANPQLIECPASYVELGATAADNCDPSLGLIVIDASAVDTSTPGSYSVTYDISDAGGNAASQLTRTVNVVDTVAPVISILATDQVVECDGAGNVAQLQEWLNSNAGATATDACSEVTWTNDFTVLSDGCGTTEVTFTATDAHGNSVSTTASFSVIDTTAPALWFERAGVAVADTTIIKPNEVPVIIDVISSDICGDVTNVITVDCYAINSAGEVIDMSGSCDVTVVGDEVQITDPVGVGIFIEITAVAEDECGNISTEVLLIDPVDQAMSTNMFDQCIFAQGYVSLGASAEVKGHVWAGAATTAGLGADVDGTVVSGAATTLGGSVVIGGDIRSGAASTLGANSEVAGTVVSGGATTLGSGATKGSVSLAPDSSFDPVVGELKDAQDFLGGLQPDFEKIGHNIGTDETWTAGVHQITGSLSVSAAVTITLDAQGNDADFIINVSGYASLGAGVKVVLANAPAGHSIRVLWNVTGTYMSLGADAEIEGMLLANTYISTGANSKLSGGAYSATSYVTTGAGSTINCGK
jgi:hypothetical protein